MEYTEYEELRKKTDLKNSDVARLAKIPPSTFTDWKQGKSKPKEEKLGKILTVLYDHGSKPETVEKTQPSDETILRTVYRSIMHCRENLEQCEGGFVISIPEAGNVLIEYSPEVPKKLEESFTKVLCIYASADEVERELIDGYLDYLNKSRKSIID